MSHIISNCQSPEFRIRSQTWGGNDNSYRLRNVESDLTPEYTYNDSFTSIDDSPLESKGHGLKNELQPKILPTKKSSRKNPWGQETYSDLIEAAINSHPNRMATLQQIYDFISKNNKYFAERIDATSSAGWKNSIRHNLSLHDKFVKCPKKNENMKSSLWSINSKCYKRERSNSMDCKRPTIDIINRRKILKEQRRQVSSNANISTNSKISQSSDVFVQGRIENNQIKISPQHQPSFSCESNDSGMDSVSNNNYDCKLKYMSPHSITETQREMEMDSEYTTFEYQAHHNLHEDLQRLDVNSMDHYHYKKEQSIDFSGTYCPNFHRAAMEYSRFIADIFIDDIE